MPEDTKTDAASAAPQAETLQPRTSETPAPAAPDPKQQKKLRRGSTYRPSHKATFIGLGVIILILGINAAIITFIIKKQSKNNQDVNRNEVTISSSVLEGLGVSKNNVGTAGTILTVGPDSNFKGKLTVAGDISVAGAFKLNSKFQAGEADITKLNAGDTALSQLNVNGAGTITNLNVRSNMIVAGTTTLQGPVTLTQLFTVNNNANIAGNLAVGGTLAVRNFQASTLASDGTLTIGGHFITRGPAPGVSPGSALGSNGTVSISGNDMSGTVQVNIGVGASSGLLASVAFRSQYSSVPHVVITPIGGPITFYISRNSGGFNIMTANALAPGGYAFDYIVVQ